jgi:hypothetical protein
MKIFLDIETLPTRDEQVIAKLESKISPPGNITKPESIDKWMAENKATTLDSAIRKTSFDGLYGELLSIAWAINDNDVVVIHQGIYGNERELINAFFKSINPLYDERGNRAVISQWVGHWILNFDLRFLWQRCVVLGIKPPLRIPYDAKPWDDIVFDTKVAWTGLGQYSGVGKLDDLAQAFGMDAKGDLDGSKVYDYWLAGRIEEIAEYNKQDVEKTRKLYKLMNFIS